MLYIVSKQIKASIFICLFFISNPVFAMLDQLPNEVILVIFDKCFEDACSRHPTIELHEKKQITANFLKDLMLFRHLSKKFYNLSQNHLNQIFGPKRQFLLSFQVPSLKTSLKCNEEKMVTEVLQSLNLTTDPLSIKTRIIMPISSKAVLNASNELNSQNNVEEYLNVKSAMIVFYAKREGGSIYNSLKNIDFANLPSFLKEIETLSLKVIQSENLDYLSFYNLLVFRNLKELNISGMSSYTILDLFKKTLYLNRISDPSIIKNMQFCALENNFANPEIADRFQEHVLGMRIFLETTLREGELQVERNNSGEFKDGLNFSRKMLQELNEENFLVNIGTRNKYLSNEMICLKKWFFARLPFKDLLSYLPIKLEKVIIQPLNEVEKFEISDFFESHFPKIKIEFVDLNGFSIDEFSKDELNVREDFTKDFNDKVMNELEE